MNTKTALCLYFVFVISLAGCQKESVSTVPFTDAQQAAAREAIIGSGFNPPSEVGLNEQGYVYAVVNIASNPAAAIAEPAKRAVLAMRNAVYVLPGADKDWPYKLRLMGPSPGPGLASVIGTARFSSDGGASWNPEGF